MDSAALRQLEDERGAHNYHPLPVVVASAEGAWVTDVEGRRYLDFLSAYSALNFGHRHPRLVAAAIDQLGKVTLTSRAVHSDQLGPFCEELADLVGMDRVLPMNTGAEGVETAIKVSRAWGYRVKGVPPGEAVVLVARHNFHGRTTTIISFSDDPVARDDFGPFTPGFRAVSYGDIESLRAALADPNVVAFLVEPIQGEAGVIVPPPGYLSEAAAACRAADVLFVADEVQSGLGRTGATLTCDWEGVTPDVLVLGKALGGGIVPVSAVVSRDDVLGVLEPGQHGSTFGGNPLALAVGREVVAMLATGEYQQRSRELGTHMLARLHNEAPESVEQVRGRGLWAGVQVKAEFAPVRPRCLRALEAGLIVKETHDTTLRLAPPLMIDEADLDAGIDIVLDVLG
ncbi:MAG: ornithine--oxo-acid transaminase [Actinobacteria bacterium]|nr:ornithine--oxo-acid transaminase [Actinomycetota bacterium]MCB9413489.1 ornithine--oxo-acid transaminase [Actinomycetota bacterium]